MTPTCPVEASSAATLDTRDCTGYLALTVQVDGRAATPSEAKRQLLADLNADARQLRRDLFANVFVLSAMPQLSAVIAPPVASVPYYDVAVLIQAPTIESARWLRADPAFVALHKFVERTATTTRTFVTYNQRRNPCEYGPRTPRVYVLMPQHADDRRPVVPGWGWTHRRHVMTDLLVNRRLHRSLRTRDAAGRRPQPILYRLG